MILRRSSQMLRLFAALILVLVTGCEENSTAEPASTQAVEAVKDDGFLSEPLPGARPIVARVLEQLKTAWKSRDPDYRARTRHLKADGNPKYTNRLFLESSPYLVQHAHNPTNWYPWGDEAFETAQRLGRPVLLSVGYSTCHWCHVMEEESFDDDEIARVLNENDIIIKVDREERPDVDNIYMTAVRMLTGRGGWPMTVWLTPDRKPFYGGTYFRPQQFRTLLEKLKGIYHEQPDRVAQSAADITQKIQRSLSANAAAQNLPDAQVLHALARSYRTNFDETNGGLKRAPKFPSNLSIRFLLRHYRRTGDQKSLQMATHSLEKMSGGGMYDHVGGGFHRYSTDARWQVPHFEKMLYDNALLAVAYLEGYQVTGREDFARVAREILRYAARDMTSPDGGFYSATDADSLTASGHREEGWFFIWTPAEIENVLGEERARVVNAYYAVSSRGNFEGRNILNTPRPLAEVARELKLTPENVRVVIQESRELLYNARAERPPPLRDEKILAAWNGLLISAFAQGALVLNDPSYAERATQAADFVLTRMRKDGRLLRSYKDGRVRHNAYLEDYAFLIAGLLDLYEATGDSRWLKEAIALDAVLEKHYEDKKNGGFFLTSDDAEKLLAREKPDRDGAEPSGNSVQVLNLLRLHEFTSQEEYRRRAEAALKAFHDVLKRSPSALSELMLAVDYHLDTPLEIVIVTRSSRADAEPLLAKLRGTFLPNRILAVVTEGELAAQENEIPLLGGKLVQNGQATAYVCERGVCELPTGDPEVFARQIAKVKPLGASGTKP